MHDAPAILDPHDPDVVHADVTCPELWVLVARAEAVAGHSVTDPEALLDQAHADGLLLLGGASAGAALRACAGCRPVLAAGALPLAA